MKGGNPIVYAIPFFLLFMLVEFWVSRRRKQPVYRLNDALSDLSCGIIQQVFAVLIAFLVGGAYVYLFERFRFFTLESSAWVWVLCFIGVDFFYYWFHRASHRVAAIWATHVVHHQSEDYNLAVALRQSALQPAFSWAFYLPLAFIGFPPPMFALLLSINVLYQFWIHTKLIGKLGPLEWILNTPSHHRVHHGSDPKYLDKNHAGTLIIWDRMFGTFQEEEEPPTYGITKPLRSWNPIWANVHFWVELYKLAQETPSLKDRLLIWVRPPGWRPSSLAAAPENRVERAEIYDPPLSKARRTYAALYFSAIFVATIYFLHAQRTMSPTETAIWMFAIIGSLLPLGLTLEGSLRS